ncbi:MAG: Gfo/Idh/MocA family oxidoreductase [Phycisphaeraceae bacterium]|nr:MAG: Gfo/Idh/MocA family oxidoreductase [Phycisphaeraceae bacterium]
MSTHDRPPHHAPTSRRDFVAASIASGLGLALASGAPRPAFATAPAPRAAATSSNARIGIGFIACGKRMFEMLPEFLGRADCHVLAVCDVDTTRRNHAKSLVDAHHASSGCAAFNDHRELLAHPGIDAVVISTPDHWHAIQIIDAAAAKKDIYCEKPLTLTIAEAKACIDAVRKHDRVFQTGSQQRTEYGGVFRSACEYIRAGKIGKVLHAHIGVGVSSVPCTLAEEPLEPGLDWDRWLGPAPSRPYHSVLSPRGVHKHYPDWRLYSEYSGGMMTDFGAHHFDICQWALDMDTSGPTDIIPPEDPAAQYGCRLVYPNGTTAHHGGPHGGTYVGERGSIYVSRGVAHSIPPDLLKKPLDDGDPRLPSATSHIANFIDCIKSRQRCICDVEVGARSVTVCHLANLAYWHRKRLRWDPKAWRFLTPDGSPDAKANAWLDVTRRDGYQLPSF